MGGAMIVPECDERMQKIVDLFMLTDSELARLYKCFDKLDVDRTGLIPVETLFEYVQYERNLFTDALLELLDIDYSDGEINFSEFLDILVTYCMFEKMELLKCQFLCA
jgi:Ca2+-binding EF-hand superfamily protein